jgi:hypothetical protein
MASSANWWNQMWHFDATTPTTMSAVWLKTKLWPRSTNITKIMLVTHTHPRICSENDWLRIVKTTRIRQRHPPTANPMVKAKTVLEASRIGWMRLTTRNQTGFLAMAACPYVLLDNSIVCQVRRVSETRSLCWKCRSIQYFDGRIRAMSTFNSLRNAGRSPTESFSCCEIRIICTYCTSAATELYLGLLGSPQRYHLSVFRGSSPPRWSLTRQSNRKATRG